MMGNLSLLAQAGPKSNVRSGVSVTVRQIGDEGGRYPHEPFERRLAVAVSPSPATRIKVPAGQYRIEGRLPNGDVVRVETTVGLTGSEDVTIPLGEWAPARTSGGSDEGGNDLALPGYLWPTFPSLPGLKSNFSDIVQRGDRFSSTPYGLQHDLVDAPFAPWILRLDRGPISPNGWISLLGTDIDEQSWRIDGRAYPHGARLAVEHADGVSLMHLPLPWLVENGHACDVEITYDRAAPRGSQVRIAVLDPDHGMLLGYLGAGRIADARVSSGKPLDLQIREAIESKMHNPLLAVAAAYIGLADPLAGAERRTWSPWLRNLKDRFPDLPDAAIVFARDRLDRADNPSDREEALVALKEAYLRGRPLFSIGVRYLLSGLFPYAQDRALSDRPADEDAVEMHREIQSLASRIDPRQVFVVETLDRGAIGV